MDSLGSSSGGIQYNASSKYIQVLSSDGSTWINWKYIGGTKTYTVSVSFLHDVTQWNSSGFTFPADTISMCTYQGDISFFFNFSEPKVMYVFGTKAMSGYLYDPTTITPGTLTSYVQSNVSNGASLCGIVIRNRLLYGCYNYSPSSTMTVSVFYVRPN